MDDHQFNVGWVGLGLVAASTLLYFWAEGWAWERVDPPHNTAFPYATDFGVYQVHRVTKRRRFYDSSLSDDDWRDYDTAWVETGKWTLREEPDRKHAGRHGFLAGPKAGTYKGGRKQ